VTISDERRDGRGGCVGDRRALSTGFLVHVVRQVEDVGHHLISIHEVVRVKSVNGTLFGLTERAGAGDATQHEEAEVVRVYGRGSIDHLTGLVVVIERLPHEVDIFSEGLAGALSKHEVVL
jgi:hypothetical protein